MKINNYKKKTITKNLKIQFYVLFQNESYNKIGEVQHNKPL